MITNLPATEKQAFFGLLDEYFASRPHRLPSAAAPAAAASRGGLTDRATAAAGNAAGAAASVAVSNALRDQLARTGLSSRGPPPPAPSSTSKPGHGGGPAGLVSSRTLGGFNLGSRTRSNEQQAPPPATSPSSTTTTASAARTLPPPTRTGSSVPSSAAAPTSALPEGVIGSAQVLYDYGDGSDPDDLQASEGETIYLTEKISDDWWRATSQDQSRHGIIPSTYVRQL